MSGTWPLDRCFVAVTTTWITTVDPAAIVPMLQLTDPDPPGTGVTHAPWLVLADTKLLCGERRSPTATFVASDCPELRIVIV